MEELSYSVQIFNLYQIYQTQNLVVQGTFWCNTKMLNLLGVDNGFDSMTEQQNLSI